MASNKNEGLVTKYHVRKLNNPEKPIDAIVLEFDDPIARTAIMEWAFAMKKAGYKVAADEAIDKVIKYREGVLP